MTRLAIPLLVQRAAKNDAPDAEAVPASHTFVASTDIEARDGHIIDQKTWKLDNYRKNPVVLFVHNDTEMPIGRGTVSVVENRLMLRADWDLADPMASEVARKVEGGFLNAVSVRWKPGRAIERSQLPKDDPYYKDGSWKYAFYDNDLLEVSVVPVPCDPNAIVQRGLDDIGDDLERMMLAASLERATAPLRDELRAVRALLEEVKGGLAGMGDKAAEVAERAAAEAVAAHIEGGDETKPDAWWRDEPTTAPAPPARDDDKGDDWAAWG